MMNMKPSGVQWIGDIPSEWKLGKVKNRFYSTKTIVGDMADDYERLALTLGGVIKRSKEANDGLQPEKFDGYQILKENEIVFKLIDLANVATSRVGLSPYTGIVSPAYIVLHDRQNSCPRYAEYYFLSMWMHEVFNHLGGDGVRSSINAKDLLNVPFPLISETEQKAIADYLDNRCSKIDEIIAEATASIEEYKELKQAVIDNAIMYGLNPDRNVIQSDIEWIHTVPDGWRKIKLGWICSFHNGDRSNRYPSGDDFVNDGIPFAGADSLNGIFVDTQKCRFIRREHYEKLSGLKIRKNDILYTLRGSTIGKCAITDFDNGTVASSLTGIRVERVDDVNPMFLLYWLQSICEYNQRTVLINGSTAPNLSAENVCQYKMFLPSLHEQDEIVKYLNRVIKKYDDVIKEKQETAQLLIQYKKSLIYEVVTGKKRVII